MEAFGMYLLKSAVWLTGFGFIYLLFLRNERFFLLNRIYLISGLFAAAFFPFLDWHYSVLIPILPSVVETNSQYQTISATDTAFPLQKLLLALYLLGGIYLLYRMLIQTSGVWKVIRKTGIDTFQSVKLIRTSAYPVSFSFFTFVFVNPSINERETNEIVNHEREHILQKHWIDLVLFELLLMLQWFNPMCWMYGRLIRQNHEYLADEKALQKSSNPAIYRAALLNQMFGGSVISLAHSFNYSLNTKRFNMMKNTICSPFRKLKLLLVMPFIATVFYAFATPEYIFVANNDKKSIQDTIDEGYEVKDTALNSSSIPNKDEKAKTITLALNSQSNWEGPNDRSASRKSGIKWVEPDWKWESDSVKKSGISVRGETKNPLYIVDGIIKENQSMKDIKPETIESISVWKGEKAIEKYGERAKDGAINITLKKGSPVKIGYRLDGINVVGYGQMKDLKTDTNYHPHTFTQFKGNGVVLKYGAANDSLSENHGIRIRGTGEKPLLVVDGVIPEDQNINSVSPEDIASISILKEKSATLLFGKKGSSGVVLITLKKGHSSGINQDPTNLISIAKPVGTQNEEKIGIEQKVFARQTGENKPLIVKDDKIAEDQNITEFGTKEAIDKISILKGKEATDRYGELGRNGVIELTTKKEKLGLELPNAENQAKETDPNNPPEHKLIIVTYADKKQAIVTLEGSSDKKRLEVNLYDKFGKLVQLERCKGPSFSYPLKNLATGTYFMVAEDGRNKYSGFLKY